MPKTKEAQLPTPLLLVEKANVGPDVRANVLYDEAGKSHGAPGVEECKRSMSFAIEFWNLAGTYKSGYVVELKKLNDFDWLDLSSLVQIRKQKWPGSTAYDVHNRSNLVTFDLEKQNSMAFPCCRVAVDIYLSHNLGGLMAADTEKLVSKPEKLLEILHETLDRMKAHYRQTTDYCEFQGRAWRMDDKQRLQSFGVSDPSAALEIMRQVDGRVIGFLDNLEQTTATCISSVTASVLRTTMRGEQ